jgi:hypothetical protein
MYTATITHRVLDTELEIAGAEGNSSNEAADNAFEVMPAEFMAVPNEVMINVAKDNYYPLRMSLSTYLAVRDCEEIAA